MENKIYAIIGGFDPLSLAVFKSSRKINSKSIFINVSNSIIKNENIYNLKIH